MGCGFIGKPGKQSSGPGKHLEEKNELEGDNVLWILKYFGIMQKVIFNNIYEFYISIHQQNF